MPTVVLCSETHHVRECFPNLLAPPTSTQQKKRQAKTLGRVEFDWDESLPMLVCGTTLCSSTASLGQPLSSPQKRTNENGHTGTNVIATMYRSCKRTRRDCVQTEGASAPCIYNFAAPMPLRVMRWLDPSWLSP